MRVDSIIAVALSAVWNARFVNLLLVTELLPEVIPQIEGVEGMKINGEQKRYSACTPACPRATRTNSRPILVHQDFNEGFNYNHYKISS